LTPFTRIFYFLLLLIIFCIPCFSQKFKTKAEVENALHSATHDTSRMKLTVDNAEMLGKGDPDSVLLWLRKGKAIGDGNTTNLKSGKDELSSFLWKRFTRFNSVCCNKIGFMYYQKADFKKTFLYDDSALILSKSIDFKPGIASAYNAIAICHQYQGNIKLAIQYYASALKIHKEMKNTAGIITTLINQAIAFNSVGDKENGIEYYEEAILMAHKAGLKDSEGSALSNFAGVLVGNGMNEKALICLEKGMQIAEETNDRELKARLYYTYGVMDYNNHRFDDALANFTKAKVIQEVLKQNLSLSNTYSSISNVYFAKKNYKKALELLLFAHQMDVDYGIPDKIEHTALSLSGLYEKLGDKGKALQYFKLHVKMKDSVMNESNKREALKHQLQNDFDKKAAADSVAHAKESEIKTAQLSKQAAELKAKKNQQYVSFGGLALILLFSIFMFNRWKVTQKQKIIIEKQKSEVEKQKSLVDLKQKEVIDSIKYAKRIQLAQMPSEKRLQSLFRQMKK
jgi:tetratricopeptide (TPR) repeat protein